MNCSSVPGFRCKIRSTSALAPRRDSTERSQRCGDRRFSRTISRRASRRPSWPQREGSSRDAPGCLSLIFSRWAASLWVMCLCLISFSTRSRSRSGWFKVIRSASIAPSATYESGHFYFAQTGHSHFAATRQSRTLKTCPSHRMLKAGCSGPRAITR